MLFHTCSWHIHGMIEIYSKGGLLPTTPTAPRRAIHDQLSATCGKNLSKLFGFVYLCLGRVRVGFAAGA